MRGEVTTIHFLTTHGNKHAHSFLSMHKIYLFIIYSFIHSIYIALTSPLGDAGNFAKKLHKIYKMYNIKIKHIAAENNLI